MAGRGAFAGFPGGLAGLVGGTLAIGAGLALLAMSIPDDPQAPRAAPTEPGAGQLVEARITAGPLSAGERRELERLVAEAYPSAVRDRARGWGFYVDGEPMLCAETDPVRIGRAARIIAKNGHVVVEGDVSASVFRDFWALCELGERA